MLPIHILYLHTVSLVMPDGLDGILMCVLDVVSRCLFYGARCCVLHSLLQDCAE